LPLVVLRVVTLALGRGALDNRFALDVGWRQMFLSATEQKAVMRSMQSTRRLGVIVVLMLFSVGCNSDNRAGSASQASSATEKNPTTAMKSAVVSTKPSGWPAGHDTPEGAACDLARAFIEHDPQLFEAVCIRPLGGGASKTQYDSFRAQMLEHISAAANDASIAANGPKEIVGLFASRQLSNNGPASYGYAAFGLQNVRFVDVETLLGNDEVFVCRTLVLQDKDDKWCVLPCPEVYGLLSAGLNDESQSSERWAVKSSR